MLPCRPYFIDGIAFATESFAVAVLRPVENSTNCATAVALAAGTSIALGLAFSLALCCYPIFSLVWLTGHGELINQVQQYVRVVGAVLASVAIRLHAPTAILGLTAGKVLRNATVLATGIGFLPLALQPRRRIVLIFCGWPWWA